MPALNKKFNANPAYQPNGTNASATRAEELILDRAELLGLSPRTDEEHLAVVRFLIFNKHHSVLPILYHAFLDVLNLCFVEEKKQVNFPKVANVVLRKAKLLCPAPAGSKRLQKLKSIYSDFLEHNAKERKQWTASDKTILADALNKLKEALGLSNEDLKEHTSNNGNSPQNGTTIGKIIRAVIAIALSIGVKTVSHFLRTKLDMQGGWADLFNDKEWFKCQKLGGSFGSIKDLKRNQDTHWGLRLKVWAEEFLQEHEEVSIEEVYVFCTVPASEEEEEGIAAGRTAFKAHLVGRARAEKYPDTKHLMRNIYRACDPRAGVGFRSMDKNDYAMAVRCCKLKGIGAAGFILASEKTGLAYAQIYELQFGGLPNFQKRVKKCDPKQPEPYIARLAAESAEYEESDEDEDDGAQEEEDDDNQDNEDGDEVAEKVD